MPTPTMQRADALKLNRGAYKAMLGLQAYVDGCGLDRTLTDLVKVRASQINGCAFCIAMHWAEARQHGESEQRLYLLNAWRDAPIYNDKERAVLAWTEAQTLISRDHMPDDVYEEARRQFSEKELVDLSTAVVAINGWNRILIAFRVAPRITVRATDPSAAPGRRSRAEEAQRAGLSSCCLCRSQPSTMRATLRPSRIP